MAKLLKQVGATLRAKTFDEGESTMRGMGATGIFRNLAFQEAPEEGAMSPSGKARRSSIGKRKDEKPLSTEMSISTNSTTGDSEQGATVWASSPHTPVSTPAGKRAGSQPSLPTPRGSQRLSALKRPKNLTEVEEIGGEVKDDDTENGEFSVMPVGAWAQGPAMATTIAGAVQAWEEEVKRLVLAGRCEDAVRWAAPSNGMIRCTMRRIKNFLGNTVAYHLFLDSGDTFLLAARKRKKSSTSNYVLSTSQDDLGKSSGTCIAKLRANFVGTEYSMSARTAGQQADDEAATSPRASTATSPRAGSPPGAGRSNSPSSVRPSSPQGPFCREELAVHYKQTVLTAKGGPRVMLIATPLPEVNWAPCTPDGSDTLASCLEAARRRELSPRLERQLCMLATRPPEWDTVLKAYTLDFHGRVRASSVKNFQLVHWDHNTDRKGADLVLQFGKVSEGCEDFALDFTYPLNLQKAFAIALASTDSKLCYAL